MYMIQLRKMAVHTPTTQPATPSNIPWAFLLPRQYGHPTKIPYPIKEIPRNISSEGE